MIEESLDGRGAAGRRVHVPVVCLRLPRHGLQLGRPTVMVNRQTGDAIAPGGLGRLPSRLDLSGLFEATPYQRRVVKLLGARPMSTEELSKALGLTRSWTTRLVDPLVQRGLLVTDVDAGEARVAWGGGLRDLARCTGGISIPVAPERIGVGTVVARPRLSTATILECLRVVVGAKVEIVEHGYERVRIAREEGGSAEVIAELDGAICSLPLDAIEAVPSVAESLRRQGSAPQVHLRRRQMESKAFCGMGNESGWNRWTGSAATHFSALGAETEHVEWCAKAVFELRVRSPEIDLYYHLCHGGSQVFQAGDHELIGSDEIAEWMEGRAALQFTFIGSCGGMESTGPGTLSWAFSKGQESSVVLGYVGMGEPGSGWTVSLPWQDYLFGLAIGQGTPVYEAALRAQTRFPQMSRNWGFFGDKSRVLKVRTLAPRPHTEDEMWKRASGGTIRLDEEELVSRASEVLRSRVGDVAAQLHVVDTRLFTEEDTGAHRFLVHFERRAGEVAMPEEYVSVEVDPADGSLIGYHAALRRDVPAAFPSAEVEPAAADRVALVAVRELLGASPNEREPEVKVSRPARLTFASEVPFVSGGRRLAYLVDIACQVAAGVSSVYGVWVDPVTGAVLGTLPPTPAAGEEGSESSCYSAADDEPGAEP